MKDNMFQVDHIGVAVKSIEIAKLQYEALGYHVIRNGTSSDENQRIRALFLQSGDQIVELLEPIDKTDEKCPLKPYLSGMTFRMYHTCYRVKDIHEALSVLKQQRYAIVCEPVSGPVFDNRLIAFAFHARMGLVELVEMQEVLHV